MGRMMRMTHTAKNDMWRLVMLLASLRSWELDSHNGTNPIAIGGRHLRGAHLEAQLGKSVERAYEKIR